MNAGRTGTSPLDFLDSNALPIVAPVVRALLDVATKQPPRTQVTISEEQWAPTSAVLTRHRIETFVPAAVEAEAVRIPTAALDQVRHRLRESAVVRLRLRHALSVFLEQCDDAGVDVRVVKGIATGQLDYDNPNQRRTSDVDILVRRKHFDRICDIVASTDVHELKAEAPSRLLAERTFRTGGGVELDLHHRLFRFGKPHDEALFADPVPLPEGGFALPREARLLHAAAHLLISPPGHRQMSSLFDVAAITASGVDLERALALADLFGVRDIVRFAIWLATNIGDTRTRPPKVKRSLINNAYLRTKRRTDLETLAVMQDLHGVRDRMAYVVYQYQAHR